MLSEELIDLLHHVELSDAGWHDRVGDQVVLSAFLQAGKPLIMADALAVVTPILGNSAKPILEKSVQRLVGVRKLVRVSADVYSISESARQETAVRVAQAAAGEVAAQEAWDAARVSEGLGNEKQLDWVWFAGKVLEPLIQAQGARTYELLVGDGGTDLANKRLLAFLDGIPEKLGQPARGAIERFFSSQNATVRGHALRRLHAHLLSLAAGLTQSNLDALKRRTSQSVSLCLFIDTNVLFSLLGLHENPANNAVADLLALLDEVKGHLAVRLYVTPLTVDEARRTLAHYETRLDKIYVSPKLGEAALAADGELSGIALKFLAAARSAGKRITVADYLGPYQRDLLTVLRGKGIELYNGDVEGLSTTQPVVDDICAEEEYEKRADRKKTKSYEALRHDVTLWHLVNSRRPSRVDAPLDAMYWIATVDNRFVRFDSFKRGGAGVPLCVHPSTLVQMLQLWLPRSPALEAALFDGLRAAVPHSFDEEAEEVAIRILRALSRYEDVDDLSEPTITAILMNRALRGRMKDEQEPEKQAELVRDEIVRVAASSQQELERERLRVAELEGALRAIRESSEHEVAQRDKQIGSAQRSASELQSALEKERAAAATLQERVGAIEGVLAGERQSRTEDDRKRREFVARRTFAFAMAMGGLAAIVLGCWLAYFGPLVGWGRAARVGLGFLLGGIWAGAGIFVGMRSESIRRWSAFTRFRRAAGWLFGVVGVGMLVNFLSDVSWN